MESFSYAWALFALLLGSIFGSFINALTFRYHTGIGMGGRSRCMRCSHELAARDLVPVFSFIFLRGRCRFCSVPISWQYPLVEILGGVLSVAVLYVNPLPLPYLFGLLLWMVLLFALVYDVQHLILPPAALYIVGALGFISLFVSCDVACSISAPTWLSLASGPLVALPLLALSLFSGGRWMGWGDGFLEIGLGWLLGLSLGFSALFIAVWSGALVGLFLVALSSLRTTHRLFLRGGRGDALQVTMGSEMPFAPFLVLGAAVAYFLHFDLFSLLL